MNYNTYALGRDGYFSLNLLTDADKLRENKVHSHTLLAALEYNNGKGYGDFNASTDNVAAYGITGACGRCRGEEAGHVRADRGVCRQGREGPDRRGYRRARGAEAAVQPAQNALRLMGFWRLAGSY